MVEVNPRQAKRFAQATRQRAKTLRPALLKRHNGAV